MNTIKIKDADGTIKHMSVFGTGTETDPHRSITSGVEYAIASGDIPSLSGINKFGANTSIAADTHEDLWDGGGQYPYPDTAVITSLSQKVDQAAMRGANIEIQGLDTNWELVTQVIALNATNTTTVEALTTPLIRVFRAKVNADVVGSELISIHNAGNTVDYAIITPENNQTLMALYTVPAGHTAYITQYYADVVESTGKEPKSTEIHLWVADRASGYEFQLKHARGIAKAASGIQHTFTPYMKINEKSDIRMDAECADEGGHVHGGFDIILKKN